MIRLSGWLGLCGGILGAFYVDMLVQNGKILNVELSCKTGCAEWNQCEIIVMGGEYAIHKLNGDVVNMAFNLKPSEGIIGLQSETAEIYYRNIEIKEFDEIIPAEVFLKAEE